MTVRCIRMATLRLATLTRSRRRRPGLGAFILPPELVLIIGTYLTDVSITSLSLTCRSLYSICFLRNLNLNKTQKEQLLLLLERDIPTVYFCHYCTKLHQRRVRWVYSHNPCAERVMRCQHYLHSNFLQIPLSVDMPYHIARLVMNRHFYGPAYGLPLRIIENAIRITWPAIKIKDVEFTQARIVDDKLLILSVKTLSHQRGDCSTLRDYIDALGHKLCGHLTLDTGSPHHAPMQIPELARGKLAPGCYFAPCHQSFRSCTFCLTDYCIDISWCGKKKGFVIKVCVYRQLGDCRSPFDWSWTSMATMKTLGKPRKAFLPQCRPGCVRDIWNEADGIVGRTESVWVEIPGLA